MTGHRAHGMGKTLVAPDWPPLTDDEVRRVLGDAGAAVRWRSPRPMSAAGLVRAGGRDVFVKRHHRLVRPARSLGAEHAFAAWLATAGIPVPAVLPLGPAGSVLSAGEWRYEAFALADGSDLYRDALSWTPYLTAGHAHAAGAALGRLHLAAAGFGAPARPFGPLMTSTRIITAKSPRDALDKLVHGRPGLAAGLDARPWRSDLARWVLPLASRASAAARSLPSQWGHGDWHPSNLSWTDSGSGSGAGHVAGVFDFGLANRTSAAHDLAVALERTAFSWLDFPDVRFDEEGARALLDGYASARPLPAAERAAVPLLLPVAHVEYALSELEYFTVVLDSATSSDLAYDYLVGHARWLGERQDRWLRFFA